MHYSGTRSVLDICVSKGLESIIAETIPALSSDHYPVIFKVHIQNFDSPPYNSIKFANWNKFQEHMASITPGNPQITTTQDIDAAVEKFSSLFNSAINTSSKVKIIHNFVYTIPASLHEKIKEKNRKRKIWQETRYPPLKTEYNKLQNEIKRELKKIKNEKMESYLKIAAPEDGSIYKLVSRNNKKVNKVIPPLLGPTGLQYSTKDKSNLTANSLQNQFTNNRTPCNDFHTDREDESNIDCESEIDISEGWKDIDTPPRLESV
ncbi:uncharacterized protein NPIL_354771 [Nephila pilipes]|uniref:Uncharacterized protein n=1 Tax=Nephila pilipes TaxID=299642 RepID=A0A8X6IGH5_NEPPI|nr:uncharacterized protein NPIL_354771 [Nephila pilipes]